MLELRNVTKRFPGTIAVDNISFSAHPGEITGYLGPNGSGKSTTMKMITALIEASSGEILFDGKRIQSDLIAYKKRMGYVPEEPHLYAHLSGLEYLVMVSQLRGLTTKTTANCIDGLLRLFSLHSDRHSPISNYSKGMRQKVLLAAALLHNPDLILLDEPFSGLDVGTALVLRSLIQELAARGKVVLFSSHELETVERVSSRRGNFAPRQDRSRRFHRAAANANGAAYARRYFLAACRRAGYCGDFTRDCGSDQSMRR